MSAISVIIPVLRDDEILSKLLLHLSDMNISEIVISDAEEQGKLPNTMMPHDLKVRHIISKPGRGPQIKSGLKHVGSNIVWVLHADSIPHKKGPEFICEAFKNPNIVLTLFSLKFDDTTPLLSLFSWLSKWESPLTTFGDQGYAFRRSDYEALSLDLDHYPLLEDVALRHALKRKGRLMRSDLPIITSARRFKKHGVVKTQFLNAKILWRYFRGEDPQRLYALYYS